MLNSSCTLKFPTGWIHIGNIEFHFGAFFPICTVYIPILVGTIA